MSHTHPQSQRSSCKWGWTCRLRRRKRYLSRRIPRWGGTWREKYREIRTWTGTSMVPAKNSALRTEISTDVGMRMQIETDTKKLRVFRRMKNTEIEAGSKTLVARHVDTRTNAPKERRQTSWRRLIPNVL